MAVFTYKASDLRAGDTSGTIAADTPRQARDLLRDRGLMVRDLRDHRPTASGSKQAARARVRTSRGMAHFADLFIRELSTLLGVGVPLLEALDTIAKQHHGRFHASIIQLRDRVAAGASLAQAMTEQPRVFDDLCINITEVGEDAGTLDT